MPDPKGPPNPPPGWATKDEHQERAKRVESVTTTYYDHAHEVLQQDVAVSFITE